MSQIIEKSFLEETRKTEQFLRNEFPPLHPAMEKALDAVVSLYMDAGSPNGASPDAHEMQDKALQWLDEMHDLVQSKETDEETVARMQMMLEEAHKTGDMVTDKNGVDVWTPLGISRWLYVSLHVLLGHAEEQGRGLTTAEKEKLESDMRMAYHALASYREAMG